MALIHQGEAPERRAANENQHAGCLDFNYEDALKQLAQIQRAHQVKFAATHRLEALSMAIKRARRQNTVAASRRAVSGSGMKPLARPDAANTANSNSPTSMRACKLPKYALKANLARLVLIFCKGDCVRSRWAEMNADYPGREVLWRSQVGDFRAICLRCGAIALDCYNWLR